MEKQYTFRMFVEKVIMPSQIQFLDGTVEEETEKFLKDKQLVANVMPRFKNLAKGFTPANGKQVVSVDDNAITYIEVEAPKGLPNF